MANIRSSQSNVYQHPLFVVNTDSSNIINKGVKESSKVMNIIIDCLGYTGLLGCWTILLDAVADFGFNSIKAWIALCISIVFVVVKVWKDVRKERQRYRREELELEKMEKQLHRK